MTRQEAKALLIETANNGGFPSILNLNTCFDEMPSCAYRSKDGKKCAVGIFIPDEIYNLAMEGRNIHSVWPEIENKLTTKAISHSEFANLQDAHDCSFVEEEESYIWDKQIFINKVEKILI